MSDPQSTYFDQAAAAWDDNPVRVALLRAVAEAMHHVADTESMLRNFHALLWPGGVLCVSDLDTEPGVFHDPEAAATVHHHGFDRREFRGLLEQAGFHDIQDTTAHTIRKPVAGGGERDFPVFLMTGRH